MTDDDDVKLDDKEEAQVRDLLKRALSNESLGDGAPDLLAGVQRRIRRRSRGKFFGDGWSTGQARIGYVLVALVTLLLVLVAYYALGPMDVR
ncbi:MAG TPA: hypothetical protein VMI75_34765 [Polyangiaceae bacterium]|nr:hypothetical protein [Polyangiaceae bacterium]